MNWDWITTPAGMYFAFLCVATTVVLVFMVWSIIRHWKVVNEYRHSYETWLEIKERKAAGWLSPLEQMRSMHTGIQPDPKSTSKETGEKTWWLP